HGACRRLPRRLPPPHPRGVERQEFPASLRGQHHEADVGAAVARPAYSAPAVATREHATMPTAMVRPGFPPRPMRGLTSPAMPNWAKPMSADAEPDRARTSPVPRAVELPMTMP